MQQRFSVNNEIVEDKIKVVNGFNRYFSTVGSILSNAIPETNKNFSHYLPPPCLNTMYLMPTNATEVKQIVMSLKKKSPGCDGIIADIVKKTYPFYLDVLVHLINLSLSQGVFPSELKLAKVIPLYKGGDKELMNNYRPISILPLYSKLFERIMHSRLWSYINRNNLLYKYQF